MKIFFILQLLVIIFACSLNAKAARLKDIANIRGVRSNQLVGYGLVVGLNGTGDSKAEYTDKSLKRMLDHMGMKLQGKKEAVSKNVAGVIITAILPPFARAGNQLDVTVNAIGDASSLKGGTLVQSPLRAADQQIYAVAQGPLLVGHAQGGVHENVGRISNGAIIEKDVGAHFSNKKVFRLTLHNPDFTTAARVVQTINMELAGKYANALDAGTVDVISPPKYEGKGVELLSMVESLDVYPDIRAKVVVNEKTGTVVIGHRVRISKVAISHGGLSIKVGKSSPKDENAGQVVVVDNTASVGDLVKILNRMAISPKDLITVLQNIKSAGALQGELEIL